jgi:hypothetical protein
LNCFCIWFSCGDFYKVASRRQNFLSFCSAGAPTLIEFKNRLLEKSSDPARAGCYEMDMAVAKKLPGEGFKRPWPPLIKMDVAVKAKVNALFGNSSDKPSVRR